MSKPLVSIFTANSNSGLACVKELFDKYLEKVQIRAVFRSEEKAKPYREMYPNIEIVVGCDAAEPDSLAKAFKEAKYALIVTPHDPKRGFSDDAQLTKNMIDSAVANHVEYIILVASFTVHHPVRMSLLSSRFLPSERLLEKYGKEKGLKWTVLRGGVFMENTIPSVKKALQTSVLNSANICVPYIDTKDIGRCAAACFAGNINEHHAKYYEMNGPERLSGKNMAEIISKVFNKDVRYEEIQKEAFKYMPDAVRQAYEFMSEDSNCVPFNNDVKNLTGKWSNYEEFLLDHKNEILN